ncbi:hypothetical protein [Amycolatopsis sp. 195334CR]|uniref:hypothetical protein n=1 Tax=Amycolatopsis sp. 195334CR TaxID=2814588 RepID=UPI001A8CDC94|nr:hypothetical protein [Amycolatopsis sp. 195334CR]MBN6035663.1 hypothetical protein [Amycolatopsis sp. 195334CR]
MRRQIQRTAAVGAATFLLAGSAAIATPATASAADTKKVPCGSSVTAKPGDTILGTTPLLGIPLNLGIVNEATKVLTGVVDGLLGGLCKVTVTVIDTVVAPVPGVGAPIADATKGVVDGVHSGTVGVLNGGQQAPESKPGSPQTPPGSSPGTGGAPQTGPGGAVVPIPQSNSEVLGGSVPAFANLPTNFSTGFAPMRDYSTIPMATAGIYSPSPGVRYGGQIPGYAPEFGILGADGQPVAPDAVQNAGGAEALPSGGFTEGTGLPVLLAVLALSGVTAALVRTWVLRKVAA